jgi:hypothetical protein
MGASSAAAVLAPQIDVGLGVPIHASTALASSSLYHGTITSASYSGWRHEFPSVDISARKYLCFQSYHNDARRDFLDTLPNGGCRLILQDGSGGTAAYNFCGNEWGAPWQQSSIADGQYAAYQGYEQPFCSIFAIEMSKAPDIDNGLDFSDIVAYEVHYKPLVNSYQGLGVAVMAAMDEAVGIGTVNLLGFFNEITNPASPNWDFERHFVRSPIFQRVIYETFVTTLGLKIGDGVSTTSWTENNFQLSAWEHGRDSAKIAPYNNLGTVRLIDVNQAPDNTLNLTDGTIGAVTDYDPLFGWKLQGSGSASLSGIVFVGLSAVECGHGNYAECTFISNRSKVLVNSSTVFNNCSVSDSQGIEITSGAGDYSQLAVQFSGNTEDIALGVGGAGTYNLTGVSGTGLIIRNNSPSNDITVLLANGVSATTVTDGGAIVLTYPSENYTLSIPNPTSNSRFYVKNLDTGIVLINSIYPSGMTEIFTKGTDYSTGDTLEYRITYKNGVTANEIIVGQLTMPASTTINSVPVQSQAQETYNAYAKDGATVAGITWDSANMEFDFDDLDGKMPGQDIGAWYYDFIYTAIGIDEAFGAFEWPQLNILTNKASVASIEYDNVAVLPLQIQNCYITKDDGSRIIKIGSAISIEPPAVFVATVGDGPLTPSQEVQLANASASYDPSTGTSKANIKYVNDVEVKGVGTTDNPWNPV